MMASKKEIIEKAREFVEKECKKPSSHYGYEVYFCHFIPMVAHAKNLASDEKGADLELVEIAAWLHDIGSVIEGRENHHITGAQIAEKKLREWGLEEDDIRKILHCILSHRGSQSIERQTKEAQIIADADTLSAFDNVSGLFKAAIFFEGLDQVSAKAAVKGKLVNSWNKLSEKAKRFVQPKYEAAMILLS